MPPASTHRVPSTDGVDLAVHDLGGHGPPLLIVHATGFHGRAYTPLAAALAPSHRVWALDCRGHGASTIADPNEYSWRRSARDVEVLLEEQTAHQDALLRSLELELRALHVEVRHLDRTDDRKQAVSDRIDRLLSQVRSARAIHNRATPDPNREGVSR